MLDIAKWIRVVRDFLHKLRDDAVTAYAAQAVLFLIISFFPFAMLLPAVYPKRGREPAAFLFAGHGADVYRKHTA